MQGVETSVRVLIGTLSPTVKAKLLRELTAETAPTHPEPERILRRVEVARLLGRSLRAVDLLREQGHLKPVTLPGRIRGAGFRLSDVTALIEGRAACNH